MTLADRAFEVFMQAWYLDEMLYQVITEQSHALEHVLWSHEFQKACFNLSPTRMMKLFKSRTAHHPNACHDPTSADGWTAKARVGRKIFETNIALYKSFLADSRHSIAPAPREKSPVALKTDSNGNKLFDGAFDDQPIDPTVDSMDLVDDLLDDMLDDHQILFGAQQG
ncbi:MAG: hypothetical protein SGILL_005015 [Bacillariaceae sp.]